MADLAGEVISDLSPIDAGYSPTNTPWQGEEIVNIVIGSDTLRSVILLAISRKQGWLAKILAVLLFDILVAEGVDLDRTLVTYLDDA